MAPLTEDFEDSTFAFPISGTWTRTAAQAQSGTWSLRSGVIGHNQTSDATVTVPQGAATVQFWYRVSSEEGFDFFRFLNDGVEQLAASGTVGWTQSAALPVTPGTTLTFRYRKDFSDSVGADAAYIDNLTFDIASPQRANTFDGGTPAATITPANSGGASGDAFTQVIGSPQYSTAVAHRAAGLVAVNPAEDVNTRLVWANVTPPDQVLCARLYVWLVSPPASSQPLVTLTGPSGVVSTIRMEPSGLLAVVTASFPQAVVLTTPIPVQAWCRIQLRCTIDGAGSGAVEAWLYTAADSPYHDEYVAHPITGWAGGKPRDIEFHLPRDAGGYWYLDEVAVADTPIGPAVALVAGLVAPAAEHGIASAIAGRKSRPLGQAATVDAAAAIRAVKQHPVGAAAETDAAAAIADRVGNIAGTAAELEVALPVRAVKKVQVGPAVEQGAAAALRPVKTTTAGPAVETDAASATGRIKRQQVARAEEVAAARPVSDLSRAAADIGSAGPPHRAWSATLAFRTWSAGRPSGSWRAHSPGT